MWSFTAMMREIETAGAAKWVVVSGIIVHVLVVVRASIVGAPRRRRWIGVSIVVEVIIAVVIVHLNWEDFETLISVRFWLKMMKTRILDPVWPCRRPPPGVFNGHNNILIIIINILISYITIINNYQCIKIYKY